MSIKQKNILEIVDLGITEYKNAYKRQMDLAKKRASELVNNTLLFTEHYPVITIGRSGAHDNLIISKSDLNEKNIDLFEVSRGGGITYHGPGQLVGYPIMKLDSENIDLHRLARDYEEVIIKTLAMFQIKATRIKGFTGVWIQNSKIAAIGVGIKSLVSFHGFAINNSIDLTPFSYMIPCGIKNKGITSIKSILGCELPMVELKKVIGESFGQVFETTINWGNTVDTTILD